MLRAMVVLMLAIASGGAAAIWKNLDEVPDRTKDQVYIEEDYSTERHFREVTILSDYRTPRALPPQIVKRCAPPMSKEEVAACKAKPAFRVMSEKEKIEINCNTKKYRVLVHVFFKQNMAGTVGKEYMHSLNNPSVFPTSHADKLVLDTITEEFCLPEGKAVKPAPGKKK